MATHKSAIKRYRQNLKRRFHNVNIKSSIKSAIKEVKDTIKKSCERAVANKRTTVMGKDV